MADDHNEQDGLSKLEMLASAFAGRTLRVAPGGPGEPAWTDEATVFLDGAASTRQQLESLTVQASLLAGGSLDRDLVRNMKRRPELAKRYLAIEAHRALTANEEVLPLALRSMVDRRTAARADSPLASLAIASGREAIADPPATFGAIRAKNLLAKYNSAQKSDTPDPHVPRRRAQGSLKDLDDESLDESDVADPFSSPIGGGGAVGKMLQRFMRVVRQISGGGPPGADAPTHRMRGGTRGAGAVVSSAAGAADWNEDPQESHGITYPEWDVHGRRYRPAWCTVQEIEPRIKEGTWTPHWDGHGLRRPLSRLGMGLDRCHRQAQGDDIDIDAAVEARVEAIAGSAPEETVYIDSLRRRRDLAVMVLLDISGSVAQAGRGGHTVHEQQRTVAAALTGALYELGDRVALYAFHSQGRSAVHLAPVKRFDDHLDVATMQRLHSLEPGAYSRLGAAIRHGTAVLKDRAGTPRRLLVVLSDGLAFDHGYERVYGAADAHRALAEARRDGIGCVGLTIGASTDAEELRQVFGSAAHAAIPRPEQLNEVIGPLFRSALRHADVRRQTGRIAKQPARQ